MFPDDPRDSGTGTPAVSSTPAPFITPEQYLEAERRAESKSEYYAGQVFPMPGASLRHNRIVGNLIGILYAELRGGPCGVYPSDLRLLVEPTGLYAYPDVTVVCGEPRLVDQHMDMLLNPTLLIEVLSDSTERYDRGRKAEHYRRIESLHEYLLVAQDEPRIEHYRRQGEREWVLTEAIGLEESIELPAIECTLAMPDVYDRVF